ncbi:MAG: 2-hydroxyacyl-CoA dehydratase family protein [Dehalococcoidia bacterium]|nr:2-hydroxyacyl-CoA dehydratase family protein [Dehalococcoidia bacterium]
MAVQAQYKVEPLETYRWAKEMRSKHFTEIMKAKEEGRLLVTGNMNAHKDLMAGIGDFAFMGGEPWAVAAIREGEKGLALPALEAVEERGYARDLCAFTRAFVGSMFLGKTPFGPFPKPDFVLCANQCDSKGKWFQIVADHFNVPYFCIEYGTSGDDGKVTVNENGVNYITAQFNEFIDWVQKFTGRPYDNQKLIDAVVNMYKVRCYWGEILQLQASIPAPLEYKLLLPFFLNLEYWSYKPEVLRLMEALRDETKYRVANGIAPMPRERLRVLHDGLPPWYALYLFRYLREHDVAVVGGSNHFMFISPVQKIRDGIFRPMDPVDWDGVPKTREEALRWRAIVSCFSEQRSAEAKLKYHYTQTAIEAWKANGIILEFDRGCEGFTLHNAEIKLALQKAGIPVMVYEANRADFREWSWSHVADSMDAFLESMGVPRSQIKKELGGKITTAEKE